MKIYIAAHSEEGKLDASVIIRRTALQSRRISACSPSKSTPANIVPLSKANIAFSTVKVYQPNIIGGLQLKACVGRIAPTLCANQYGTTCHGTSVLGSSVGYFTLIIGIMLRKKTYRLGLRPQWPEPRPEILRQPSCRSCDSCRRRYGISLDMLHPSTAQGDRTL
jgi:hypothetical protein